MPLSQGQKIVVAVLVCIGAAILVGLGIFFGIQLLHKKTPPPTSGGGGTTPPPGPTGPTGTCTYANGQWNGTFSTSSAISTYLYDTSQNNAYILNVPEGAVTGFQWNHGPGFIVPAPTDGISVTKLGSGGSTTQLPSAFSSITVTADGQVTFQ